MEKKNIGSSGEDVRILLYMYLHLFFGIITEAFLNVVIYRLPI